MQVTFDIRVSGCVTKCWHCYVDGGPGSFMVLDEFKEVLAYLKELSKIALDRGVRLDPYLDLEPLLHPDCLEIFRLAYGLDSGFFGSCIPTSGLPIATRTDWENVLKVLADVGIRELQLTLHGSGKLHDRATNLEGAFDLQRKALDRIKEKGFRAHLNLIVSKSLLDCFEETLRVIELDGYHYRRALIPGYAPCPRLRDFEFQRPELSEVRPILDELIQLCDNKEQDAIHWQQAEQCTERYVFEDLRKYPEKYSSFRSIVDSLPNWRFITVAPGLEVYYGNGNLYSERIANLRKITPRALLEEIEKRDPNYAIGGYFDIDGLPSPWEVAKASADPQSERIYHLTEDIFVKWLDVYCFSTDRRSMRTEVT